MAPRNPTDVRRLLLVSALTAGLCYLALVLAYAAYRAYFDWLGESVSRETRNAITSIFPWSVVAFGTLFVLAYLISMRFARISRPWMFVGAMIAYGLSTRLLFADRGQAALAVLNISWGMLIGLLLVYGQSRRVAGFLRVRWKHLLLSALSLFVSLELGLRAFYLAIYPGTLEELHDRPRLPPPGVEVKFGEMIRPSLNDDLVYELKSGLDVQFKGSKVTTNAQGWREKEITLAKPPGTKRILGIGDSIMFGWGVEENERYMDQLEVKLTAAFPEVRWATVVTAVPGYNLMNEVGLLEAVGLAYDPDLIIYGFCGNDERLPNFVQSRKRVLSLDSFTLFYLDLLRRRLRRAMFTSRIGGQFAANIKEDQSVPQEYRHLTGRDAFLAALRRLEAIRQKTGTPVIDFDYGRGAVHGREVPASIRYFNAQDAVEACGGEFVLSEADPHPSPKGHRALADSLYSFLVESGIVARLMEDAK